MLNVDMGFYHSFTAATDGSVTGKYCNQGRNRTMVDCHAQDPSYLPLSSNAGQVWNYAHNQTLFFWDTINAFVKMTNVPGDNDAGTYTNISPEWKCVNGVLECQGDVFLHGCRGYAQPNCP